MDSSAGLVILNTFPIGRTLPADTGIRLLRTETVFTGLTLNILLTRRTHLVLLHQRQKGWSTNVARLKKMRAVRIFQPLQRHLHRHPTGLTEMLFGGPFYPFGLKLLLACLAGTDAGFIASRVFLMLAFCHSYTKDAPYLYASVKSAATRLGRLEIRTEVSVVFSTS